MAIDSQQKRMAVVGVGRPWMRSTFPGTINEAWRLSVGNVYSGNALTPGVGFFSRRYYDEFLARAE